MSPDAGRPGPAIMATILVSLALAAVLIAGALVAVSVSVAGLAAVTPVCQAEDDPGPCHWDGGRDGNGTGRTFVTIADVPVYAPQ